MSPRPDIGDHPARVLIVDDEHHNRELLEVMLTPEGFHLQTAGSGEEALAIVARQPPDLILLDVMMPGMDGYQVAAELKGNVATKNIPVIMVTALGDRSARMRGLSAGAEEFLSKPIHRAELCVRVRNLLRLKAYSDHYEKQAAVLAEQAALLDLAQDAIVVRDMQGRIVFWNRGAEVLYGWRREEALRGNIDELFRTEFPEPIDHIEAALLRDGQWEGEAIHHKRDGARVNVASRWALQRDPDGAPLRVLTISSDITGWKRAEAERLLLTERLSLATAVAKVGVWEWHLASNTLIWDVTMFGIYGLPPVVPLPYARWSAAVYPEDLPAVEATLQKVVHDKGQGSAEFRIVLTDGSVRNLSAVERVILDERANVSRVIGVTMDITERKEAEQALERSREDRLRFKDDFLSHVSHELRSPLTAIKQFSSILLGGSAGALNEEQREYQEIVLKNIRQLQAMIDDLLEVTRLETGKLTVEAKRVSVSNAVTDTLDTLEGPARAKGVTLSRDLPLDLPCAYADGIRLRQILIILLDNAVKFTPEGGAVHVQARLLPRDPRFVLVEVSDTGCGIGPEMTEKIFDRLYQGAKEPIQASRKGLGLGLYICKELVTRQGGHIRVEGRPQKGTTFSFTLPVFSLHNVMAPLLKNDTWPAESVALVVVETSMRGAWLSPASREQWSHEARRLLEHCLLPDLDALLPPMTSGAEEEQFFLAAFADEQGVSVLAHSIRQRFERLPRLEQTGVTVTVSYRMLPSVPRAAGASTEDLVALMAASLREAITSHSIPELVQS